MSTPNQPPDRLPDLQPGLPVGPGWREVEQSREVRFPYDGSLVAVAPWGGPADAEAALAAASAARADAAVVPSHERRRWLQEAAASISRDAASWEALLVLETGKPLVDCRTEVARTVLTLQTAAEEVARLTGETVPLDLLPAGEGMFAFWVREPIGVVVGITGFNYPLLLGVHKVAPALAVGAPVILKPPPQAPLTSLQLVRLLRELGVPPAMLQAVTGGPDVGAALTTDARVGAVSFTGSADVGHRIARSAAPTKTMLELGSNAALVVTATADLDRAADAVVRGGYYASGQACIAVQRVIVERAVLEPFLEWLQPLVAAVRVGDPRDPGTRVSALIDDAATGRVTTWVDEALSAGASRLVGGDAVDGVLGPTLLVDVPDGVSAWDEEIFGPVVCVQVVEDLDHAVEVVNASRYGLHASVFTRDLASVADVARRLDVGGVVINDVPGFRADNMPYGGVKDSGAGREGPRFAMAELSVTKMVMIRP